MFPTNWQVIKAAVTQHDNCQNIREEFFYVFPPTSRLVHREFTRLITLGVNEIKNNWKLCWKRKQREKAEIFLWALFVLNAWDENVVKESNKAQKHKRPKCIFRNIHVIKKSMDCRESLNKRFEAGIFFNYCFCKVGLTTVQWEKAVNGKGNYCLKCWSRK